MIVGDSSENDEPSEVPYFGVPHDAHICAQRKAQKDFPALLQAGARVCPMSHDGVAFLIKVPAFYPAPADWASLQQIRFNTSHVETLSRNPATRKFQKLIRDQPVLAQLVTTLNGRLPRTYTNFVQRAGSDGNFSLPCRQLVTFSYVFLINWAQEVNLVLGPKPPRGGEDGLPESFDEGSWDDESWCTLETPSSYLTTRELKVHNGDLLILSYELAQKCCRRYQTSHYELCLMTHV